MWVESSSVALMEGLVKGVDWFPGTQRITRPRHGDIVRWPGPEGYGGRNVGGDDGCWMWKGPGGDFPGGPVRVGQDWQCNGEGGRVCAGTWVPVEPVEPLAQGPVPGTRATVWGVRDLPPGPLLPLREGLYL